MLAKTNYSYYIAVVILAVISYFFFDIPVLQYFHPYKNTAFYDTFKFITNFGRAEYSIVPGVLVFIIFRKSKPMAAKVGLAVALSAAMAGLSVDVVKFIAGRYRPTMLFNENLYGFAFFKYKYSMVSFPSGHSATAFGAVGVLSLVFKRFRYVFLFVGALIAFSRVATLHHYPSDVLVGAAFGMASSIFLYNKMKLYKGEIR